MSVSIERAGREELPEVFGLLRDNGLPTEGLEEHAATTLVVRDPLELIGSAALELYGAAALLLRSVAVRSDRRGRGLGRRLTGAALDPARRHCAHLSAYRDRGRLLPPVRVSSRGTLGSPAERSRLRRVRLRLSPERPGDGLVPGVRAHHRFGRMMRAGSAMVEDAARSRTVGAGT